MYLSFFPESPRASGEPLSPFQDENIYSENLSSERRNFPWVWGLPCGVVESPLLVIFNRGLVGYLKGLPVEGKGWVEAFKALLTVGFYESL